MENYIYVEDFYDWTEWELETAWRNGAEGDTVNMRYLADALNDKNLNDTAIVQEGLGWYPVTAKRHEQGWFLG